MRPVTAAATWSQHQATLAPENTRCLGSVEAEVVSAAREEQLNRVSVAARNIAPMAGGETRRTKGDG